MSCDSSPSNRSAELLTNQYLLTIIIIVVIINNDDNNSNNKELKNHDEVHEDNVC